MRSSKLVRLTTVLALGALVLQACGGDEGGNGNGGGGGGAVTADAYAAGVCGALQDWITGITDASTAFTDEIPADPSPEDSKAALESWVGELIQLSQSMVDATEAAGVPDVDGGQEIADAIAGAFRDALAGFEDLAADIQALPTDDPAAFVTATTELGESVTAALTAAATSVSGLSQPELNQAFAQNTDCTSF